MERDEKGRPKGPGLRWDGARPLWRASKPAIRAGYPVKMANLTHLADDPAALVRRCSRLQAEMLEWIAGGEKRGPVFDGSFGSLIDLYLTDPESPFHIRLKHSSRHPYTVYAAKLKASIGARQIDRCDGRDLRRWFAAWAEPDRPGDPPKLPAARSAMTVLKAAISFGIACRKPGCVDFKAILGEIEFPRPKPRTEAPTADQVVAARKAAHALGHPRAALAYAIQYETTLRQWDVIGTWVPIGEPRPSAVIDGTTKWFGPTWAQIDEASILRIMPSKTERTSEARVIFDLSACPMVVEELALIAADERRGPLVTSPVTGLPYRHESFRDVWKKVRKATGIPATVWNRDLRAGGISEGRDANVSTDDMAKVAGHSNKATTGRVYDRTALETHRRTAAARKAHRDASGT